MRSFHCQPFHCARAVLAVIAMLALTGCFASDSPVITASSAQNVGDVLEYWMRADGNPKSVNLRLVRKSGKSYQMQILDLGNSEEPVRPFANGLMLRRLGTRGTATIYLVQFDLERFELNPNIDAQSQGFRYFSYLVSINRQGIGSVGQFTCNRAKVLQHAADLGLKVSCRQKDVSFPYLGGRLSERSALSFLSGLLQDGLIDWDDETGVGVLDWID